MSNSSRKCCDTSNCSLILTPNLDSGDLFLTTKNKPSPEANPASHSGAGISLFFILGLKTGKILLS